MKIYLLIIAVAISSFTKINMDVIDRIGVKGPLLFDKTTFNLAWTSNPNNNYYVQEYLPKNETADHFNQMLSIFLLIGNTNPSNAAEQKINELKARKNTDATCNYMLTKSPDGKELMLDFVLGEKDVEEFNVYRYKQIDLPGKQKALFLYAYSKRAYGNNITPFFKNLKTDRTKYLNEMAATQMPAISLKSK